jgi:CheY-like chemotaxis protein
MYNSLLCKHGHEVTTVTDLRAAWDKLRQDPPDAALFDLVLPDTHGLELLRNVRQNTSLRDLPVIVYTSIFNPPIVEEVKEAGATRVFDKTYLSTSTLIDALNECLVPGQQAAEAVSSLR